MYKQGIKLDTNDLNERGAYCSKINESITCATDDKCLWMPIESSFHLEGPTVKNVRYIPTKIYQPKNDDEFTKTWNDNLRFTDEQRQKMRAETEESFKSNIRIRTIDIDNIMYEMELHDFDSHVDAMHNLSQSISKADNDSETLQSSRRLMVWDDVFNAGDIGNAPYTSIGLLKVGATGNAVGTIIGVSAKKRNKYNKFKQYRFVYVLVAAHDIIQLNGQMYRPANQYKFYPSFHGTNGDLAATNDIGPLVRSWHLITFPNRVGVGAGNDGLVGARSQERRASRDIGILKFKVSASYNPPVVDLYDDPEMQSATPDDSVEDAPLAPPDVTAAVQRELATYMTQPGQYDMNRQNVQISCEGVLCYYHGIFIKAGMCGGIIHATDGYHANSYHKVSAMQAEKNDLLGPNGCDTLGSNYAQCGGFAMRITQNRINAIQAIIANGIHASFTQMHAHMEYVDKYNQYEQQNVIIGPSFFNVEMIMMVIIGLFISFIFCIICALCSGSIGILSYIFVSSQTKLQANESNELEEQYV